MQVNERADAFYNNFKELISIQYCTFIMLWVVVVVMVVGVTIF